MLEERKEKYGSKSTLGPKLEIKTEKKKLVRNGPEAVVTSQSRECLSNQQVVLCSSHNLGLVVNACNLSTQE